MRKIKRYGWRPDLPDHRDRKFSLTYAGDLPRLVDLSPEFPPVYDQGELGSCTANAIAGALEFDDLKQKEQNIDTPSRLFIYYNERVIEGSVYSDSGAQLRDGIKSVNQVGAAPEELWPYNIDKFADKPTPDVYQVAIAHETVAYSSIDNTNIQNLKVCLASGFPFVFGFTVYGGFESEDFASNGYVLNVPGYSESAIGGHAVVGVGYDDDTNCVLVRNSWGTSWGIKNGHFWMSYNYISNQDLADDFWSITKVK